jgi:energy-coupling factor transporter ATP-binding protein EcfA2
MDQSIALPFRHPTTILIAGPTGSGKTEFLVKLLTQRGLEPFPERIIWIYSEWQDAYDRIQKRLGDAKKRIVFVKDFDDSLYDSLDRRVRNLVVLDDQMENRDMQRNGGSGLAKFFTQGSHHRNLTIIYIIQNLFHQARAMRTVSLNSHYLVLFKNPRDKLQIRSLALQMYPTNADFLVRAYEDATKVPYGYLVVDLRPDTPDELRVRSNIFDVTEQCVYKQIEK